MPRISVLICSHNPRADYLGRVLDCLKAQTVSKEEWELLLVDNCSERRLADVWDLSWHPQHAHIREDDLGLTAARLRGIREARGELLLFVDDDNLLAPDYLDRAAALARSYPYLGVFGAGVLEPEFEVPPPRQLEHQLSLLALRTVSSGLWTNDPAHSGCVPWGAGLCVTRPVAAAYPHSIERLKIGHILDRRGHRQFRGGDDLFSWVAVQMGRGFGIFPELRVTHLIRADRLTQSFFLLLLHDHAYSHGVLTYLLLGKAPRPLDLAQTFRIALHGIRRGRFSMRCKWASARGAGRAARLISAEALNVLDGPLTEPFRPPAVQRAPASSRRRPA